MMDAKKLLGYKDRLTMKERIAVSYVQQATDHGASFRTREDARRFARRELAIDLLVLFVFIAAIVFVGYQQFVGGWFNGYKTGLDVCRLIVMRGA